MTDLTALDELIKAVGYAAALQPQIYDLAAQAFPPESAYGNCTFHTIGQAFYGSLDAAKALHDALLPGWWYVIDHRMCSVSDMFDGPFFSQDTHDSPARAWLLAVLRAYRAQIGGAA